MFSHEQLISGKNFQHLEDFVKHKWGSDGLERFRNERPMKVRNILEYRDYPFLDFIKCIESLVTLFGDENAAYEVGEYRGRKMTNKKLKSPIDRLRNISRIEQAWHSFNNFGEVNTAVRTPTRTSIIISRYHSHPAYCQRTRGFFHGFVSGARKDDCKVTEIRCVNDGAEGCEFLIEVGR